MQKNDDQEEIEFPLSPPGKANDFAFCFSRFSHLDGEKSFYFLCFLCLINTKNQRAVKIPHCGTLIESRFAVALSGLAVRWSTATR